MFARDTKLSRLALLAFSCSLAGAVLTGLLGGAITAAVWIVESTEPGMSRALAWGMRYGLLIGAVGILTGALCGLSSNALSARLPTRRRAIALGGVLGAAPGLALALVMWGDRSGHPIAFAAIVAHVVAGASVALAARIPPLNRGPTN